MAEKIVTARHRQVCDVCHGHIEAGVKTKKGNNWSMTSVIRLLHNPIYIGKLTYKD